MTKAKEGQPFSNGIPPSYHPFFSDRFVMIILFSIQSSFILSPTQNPSVCNHCPSNLICGIVLSDLLIFPYTVIGANIVCERESHKGIIIGKGGSMLKKIGTSARIEIENLMGAKVNLQLWVKVRDKWRDSELYMKNYGYFQQK